MEMFLGEYCMSDATMFHFLSPMFMYEGLMAIEAELLPLPLPKKEAVAFSSPESFFFASPLFHLSDESRRLPAAAQEAPSCMVSPLPISLSTLASR